MQNKTLTIMFIDMQGYTSLTSDQTREEHQWFIKEINSFIQKHVEAKHGNLIKTMGDGFLITFESPTDAITCGISIQEEIKRRNASMFHENHLLRLRIGISTGEVTVTEKNDVYGEAVNIAARIEKFCEPNEIFISESTYLAMNKSEIKTKDLGPLKFKNISDDIRVFKVLKDGRVRSSKVSNPFVRLPLAYKIVFVSLLVVAGFGAYFFLRAPKTAEVARPSHPVQQDRKNPLDGCQEDVRKFCADVRPGGGRIIQCLQGHISEVAKECASSLATVKDNFGKPQETFRNDIPGASNGFPDSSSGQGAVMPDLQRQMQRREQLRESCSQDIQNYCSNVQRGGGRIVKCLKEHSQEVSASCSQTLNQIPASFSGAPSRN